MLLTSTGAQVAKVFLGAPDDEHWGTEISRDTGIQPGTVYPMLITMHTEGYVADRWESTDEMSARKQASGNSRISRRRYWRVTLNGRAALQDYLARWEAKQGGARLAR